MRKLIAWGNSKLLKMYLQNKANPFSYCIDDFTPELSAGGLIIKKSEELLNEKPGNYQVVIFAISNKSLGEIRKKLHSFGLKYGQDYIFYSDFFLADFQKKAETALGFGLNEKFYRYALSYTLNSQTLIHTTILGTWLFLELLNRTENLPGAVAEIGIFQGGNALAALSFCPRSESKNFYLFDSFEGFPELSAFDPKSFKKGDYNIQTTFQEIADNFAVYPEARLIKGFVPDTFSQIPKDEKFSLVFYDCDLYQPALDTFGFFWDRIVPGGYLLIHDYEAEKGGFEGVKIATDEFFKGKNVQIFSFFENTMALIKKGRS